MSRIAIGCLALVACTPDPPGAIHPSDRAQARVDAARLAHADREPQNWYTIHRSSASDHFSPLSDINDGNVGSLGFAWEYATQTTRGLEASPVVIDGVLYASGNWGRVYALDAATGAELWTYVPNVPGAWGRRACCDVVNRGVAVWQGRVYVASLDGYLVALDSVTGRTLWRQDTFIDRTRFQTITGAPQIAGDKVVIGQGGAEFGVRGYISAYDAATGELAWRFFTVPGDPKEPVEHPELALAAKTWDPDSQWDVGGGGTAWDAMAYDPVLNLLYVGTGNGSPHAAYSRSPRGGDNLFLASILAINPDTGRLVWHYQTTPADSWDYTATQHMILTELTLAGRRRQVLMQAPKNGFFYVLDRATGELLAAEKYATTTWASHIDLSTGRPVLTPQADYSEGPKLIYPGQRGAHNWHPMSFSPVTELVYLPVIERPQIYHYRPGVGYRPGTGNEQVEILRFDDPRATSQLPQGVRPVELGYLEAWDPVRMSIRWRVPLSDGTAGGGVLATAGNLVFRGGARGFLEAYAADTGALLASFNVGTGMMAAPISYAVDGVQYVAVLAGVGGSAFWTFPKTSAPYRYGNAGRIVAFKLGGGPVPLPPRVDHAPSAVVPSPVAALPTLIARGAALFDSAGCPNCHGRSPGLLPDRLTLARHELNAFRSIVYGGAFESRGMPSFRDLLSESDVDAIHAYLVDEAIHEMLAAREAETRRNH